jgi:hypothetical protein
VTSELLNDLNEVFPPVQIALPTRGIFYPEGVLAKSTDPECISVGTLGILDEFKYRDPFMLVSGKAIGHLIHHICGDQIILPDELCEIDVEALLIASRIASYGPNLKVTHNCIKFKNNSNDDSDTKVCGHANTLNIDLNKFILRYGPIIDEDKFAVKLPRVGQTVFLKPTPYKTTIEVMRNMVGTQKKIDDFNANQEDFIMNPELFTKYEDLVNVSTELQVHTLLDCIYGVQTRSGNIVEDQKEILNWIFELPKSDYDIITKRIQEITDDFRKISSIPYICESCGNENDFNLQMNAEILFLAGSEDSEAKMISSDMPAKNKNTFRTRSRISQKLP